MSTLFPLLSGLSLLVLAAGGGRFVRDAQRVRVGPPSFILVPLYAAFALALAAVVGASLAGDLTSFVLGLAAPALLFGPALLFVMHRRRTPLGELRVHEGDCLPTFTALRADGSVFDSRELRGSRVLLKVFRGHWCPFCSAELRQFEAMRPGLEARGVRVIALSKDVPADARHHAQRDGLRFPLLCDPDLKVIRRLGIEHRKALEISGGHLHLGGFPVGLRPRFQSMAIPTTFLMDEAGRVRYVDQSADYQVRADASRLGQALDEAFGPASADAEGAGQPLPSGPALVAAPCP